MSKKHVNMTPKGVDRLKENLRLALTFIERNIPDEVIAVKQTHGIKNARDALHGDLASGAELTYAAHALLWSVGFIMDNHHGGCVVLVDALDQLSEFGFMERSVIPMSEVPPELHGSIAHRISG
jgi:hypothetical protein